MNDDDLKKHIGGMKSDIAAAVAKGRMIDAVFISWAIGFLMGVALVVAIWASR